MLSNSQRHLIPPRSRFFHLDNLGLVTSERAGTVEHTALMVYVVEEVDFLLSTISDDDSSTGLMMISFTVNP